MTSTGPTPASVELVGALLRRPPAAAVLLALAVRPRQVPERLSAALDRAHRDGRVDANRARRAQRPRRRGSSRRRGRARRRCGPLRGERRQPLLPRAARAVARPRRWRSRRFTTRRRWPAIGVPPSVGAALSEELALLSDSARLVLEGAAVAGDPVRARAGGGRDAAARGVGDGGRRRAPPARSSPAHRRAAAFPLPAPARAARGLRGDRGRLAAGRSRALRRGARGSRRDGSGPRPSRRAVGARGRRPRRRRSARGRDEAARLAPASAARWFGDALRLLPATAPAEERVELLLARAGALDRGRPFQRQPRRAARRRRDRARRARAAVPLASSCAAVETLLGRRRTRIGNSKARSRAWRTRARRRR